NAPLMWALPVFLPCFWSLPNGAWDQHFLGSLKGSTIKRSITTAAFSKPHSLSYCAFYHSRLNHGYSPESCTENKANKKTAGKFPACRLKSTYNLRRSYEETVRSCRSFADPPGKHKPSPV